MRIKGMRKSVSRIIKVIRSGPRLLVKAKDLQSGKIRTSDWTGLINPPKVGMKLVSSSPDTN